MSPWHQSSGFRVDVFFSVYPLIGISHCWLATIASCWIIYITRFLFLFLQAVLSLFQVHNRHDLEQPCFGLYSKTATGESKFKHCLRNTRVTLPPHYHFPDLTHPLPKSHKAVVLPHRWGKYRYPPPVPLSWEEASNSAWFKTLGDSLLTLPYPFHVFGAPMLWYGILSFSRYACKRQGSPEMFLEGRKKWRAAGGLGDYEVLLCFLKQIKGTGQWKASSFSSAIQGSSTSEAWMPLV